MTEDTEDQMANGAGAAPDDPGDAAPETDAEAAVAALQTENEQLRERMLRAAADAENTRKRAEREVTQAREYAIEKFAGDLLGVADNLSRALASIPPDQRDSAPEATRNLLSGVEMTQRELQKAFERNKISLIEPKGEPFDPNFHQAVAQIPSETPAGRVAEVMQAGYRLGDRVLRAAMVAVSSGPGAGAAPAEPSAGEQSSGGDAPQQAPGAQTDVKV